MSNYARPGHQARHNSAYWSGVPYAGIGPSAHEFDGVRRRWNEPAYAAWLQALARGADPLQGSELLDDAARETERVYLGLRTSQGLRMAPTETAHVTPWLDAGWGNVRSDGRLQLTPLGWLRLDALAGDLTGVRSR